MVYNDLQSGSRCLLALWHHHLALGVPHLLHGNVVFLSSWGRLSYPCLALFVTHSLSFWFLGTVIILKWQRILFPLLSLFSTWLYDIFVLTGLLNPWKPNATYAQGKVFSTHVHMKLSYTESDLWFIKVSLVLLAKALQGPRQRSFISPAVWNWAMEMHRFEPGTFCVLNRCSSMEPGLDSFQDWFLLES